MCWIGTNENLYERYFYTVDPLDGAAGIGGNLPIFGTPGYGSVRCAGHGANLDATARLGSIAARPNRLV